MDERVVFITHQDQEILLIDFSGCQAKEILLLLEEVKQTVAGHERNSVLTLATSPAPISTARSPPA